MSSPNLPDKGWEDISVELDGEVVTSIPGSEVDRLIMVANSEEMWSRRVVAGWDMERWLLPVDDLTRAKRYPEALDIMADLRAAAASLTQYDTREPDPYWFERTAVVHRRIRNYAAEVAVLEVWLAHWPPDRFRPNQARQRIATRLARAKELHSLQ
ncbi:hypothetical protein ACQCSX_04545 [Pseudarthrobacter sp. P1]|uniref:hypothetical protein n=1 Tax=Pseudarthrobacter sp. P1 TaxID=3418418 RepID=UPI003CF3EE21